MEGEMSSLDENVIGGCHPWMEMTDDGHGQSIRCTLKYILKFAGIKTE